MLTKVLVFGLLCSNVIQAFPTNDDESEGNGEKRCLHSKPESDSKPKSDSKKESYSKPDLTSVNQTLPCADQIEWFKSTTLEAKNEYEKYYKAFKDNSIDVKNLDIVKAEHEHIEALIADSLKKCDVDLKNLRAKVTDNWNICRDELKSFSIMNRNLSALTQKIRPQLIDYAKKIGLSHETVDYLDQTLGRIVNFMFIIDMGKNTFRDIHSMVKDARVKTEDGIKLEEKYKFTEEGVEAIGELGKKEKIGHVEEPAVVEVKEVVLKPKEGHEVVGKVKGRADNVVDINQAEDKEFKDLIDLNDQDITKSEKELEHREQQQTKEQRIAERQHLTEQERLEEENRLQRERKMIKGKIEIPKFHG